MDYAVIDLETTGGKYNEEAITEIAIHRFDGLRVTDSFISLINPEKEIQPYVAKLTGINRNMLKNAPKFYEIAKRVIEITNDCILVAHNASFDYRVLKNEFDNLGYEFDLPTLCTVELSQRIIPDMESYSLGKLCRAIGIPVSDRHRANGDALAALKLLEVLLQKDSDKIIVKECIKIGNHRDLSNRLLNILETLPTQRGLFYFHRYNGDVVFIGRAKNIQLEVNQIFLKKDPRNRSLLKVMQTVSFELTGSELISLVKVEEELAVHKPSFNKKKKLSDINVCFNHENLVLIDKGRSPEEKSIVLIEQNQYMGYAFADLNHQFNNYEVLKSLINLSKIKGSQNQIVKNYLDKNQVEKIIRF